ncbi:hypothetical protein [Sporosarcina koreensis]|uniref:hypothetical protein n=1 Tax=Sporosarcina koreensis TaxID=334735 RepID=UPI00058D16FE|nr:hypothetical protein [Sporosarcina koreensis]
MEIILIPLVIVMILSVEIQLRRLNKTNEQILELLKETKQTQEPAQPMESKGTGHTPQGNKEVIE